MQTSCKNSSSTPTAGTPGTNFPLRTDIIDNGYPGMALPRPLAKRERLQSVTAKNYRSIVRTTRPPSLNLEASNGVTRWNSPLLPQTAPVYPRHPSPGGNQLEISRYSPLSEGPVTASATDLPNMGITVSKENTPPEDSHQPSRRKHLIFRRHSKSPPPRPPTFNFPPSKPATQTKDDNEYAPPIKEQPTQDGHESSNPTTVGQETESQQPSIQTLPSTPPYDAGEEPSTNKHRIRTPMLRLPTPSLMPEESPGKYGMGVESTSLRHEPFTPRTRPKSGTGAQLFKVRPPLSSFHSQPPFQHNKNNNNNPFASLSLFRSSHICL